MAIFQDRFVSTPCVNTNKITKDYVQEHKDKIKCYNPSILDTKAYGKGNEGFEYLKLEGVEFYIDSRIFSTDDGYYFFAETDDLQIAKQKFLKKIDEGWVDINTKYVGIMINFYDKVLHIMMYYAVFYDFRFGSDVLVFRLLIIVVC